VSAQENHSNSVVLIIDDDPALCNSLVFSLRMEGIRVLAYANGAQLLREAPLSSAGCLVIDYKLPGMNGLELLAELRRRQVTAPAILITTNPTGAVRERAALSGIALVEKPLLGDALFQQIRAALAM